MKKFLAETYLWILLLPWTLFVAGAACNQIALMANGDVMPVLMNEAKVKMASDSSAEVGGITYLDPRHSVMTKDSHVKFLCDIIDVGDIMSVGDVGIDIGQWMLSWAPFLWGFLLCLKVYKLTV